LATEINTLLTSHIPHTPNQHTHHVGKLFIGAWSQQPQCSNGGNFHLTIVRNRNNKQQQTKVSKQKSKKKYTYKKVGNM